MKTKRLSIHASTKHLGLVFVLLGTSLAACDSDDAVITRDHLDSREAPSYGANCTDYQGLTHCPLGDAKLLANKEEPTLDVTSLRTPEKDGVAILLPEVTQFVATGTRNSDSAATMIARSISKEVVTSTMTVQNTDDGFDVSGLFTGNEQSTYNVHLYKEGSLVGIVSGQESGKDHLQVHWADENPEFRIRIRITIEFDVITITITRTKFKAGADPSIAEGACVWDLPLGGRTAWVKLENGTEIKFDRLLLVENVREGGSYPYMAFDRIDLTSNDESFQLDSERTR